MSLLRKNERMVKVIAPIGVLSVLTCTANKVLKQLPKSEISCMQRRCAGLAAGCYFGALG